MMEQFIKSLKPEIAKHWNFTLEFMQLAQTLANKETLKAVKHYLTIELFALDFCCVIIDKGTVCLIVMV